MLRLNLNALQREGALRLEAACPPENFAFDGRGPGLPEPVEVWLEARYTVVDHVIVQGRLSTTLSQVCRRCLEPVEQAFALPVHLLFVPADEFDSGDDDGEVHTFPPHLADLDLATPLREEFALSAPMYVECRADCRGLCPECGINRNLASCDCSPRHPDARWEKLRALTNH